MCARRRLCPQLHAKRRACTKPPGMRESTQGCERSSEWLSKKRTNETTTPYKQARIGENDTWQHHSSNHCSCWWWWWWWWWLGGDSRHRCTSVRGGGGGSRQRRVEGARRETQLANRHGPRHDWPRSRSWRVRVVLCLHFCLAPRFPPCRLRCRWKALGCCHDNGATKDGRVGSWAGTRHHARGLRGPHVGAHHPSPADGSRGGGSPQAKVLQGDPNRLSRPRPHNGSWFGVHILRLFVCVWMWVGRVYVHARVYGDHCVCACHCVCASIACVSVCVTMCLCVYLGGGGQELCVSCACMCACSREDRVHTTRSADTERTRSQSPIIRLEANRENAESEARRMVTCGRATIRKHRID